MALTVLGIDSAGPGASAAIVRGSHVLATRRRRAERGQAEILMPMIAETLAAAGLEIATLDAIAVAVGPGSFTGLRIAIAAARGLAVASGVPAVGISSFAAIAAQVPPGDSEAALLVALDTRRDDFYLQLFDPAHRAIGQAALLPGTAVASWLPHRRIRLTGDAAARLAPFLAGREAALVPGVDQVRAEDVARLAGEILATGQSPPPPRPVYLRAPDTTAPRPASLPR